MKIVRTFLDSLLTDIRYQQIGRQPRVYTTLAPLGLAPLLGMPPSRTDNRRR
ncbi:hypothetical protein [Chelativorans salis]|uniref:Uncharacterized protein n=1 Tax=Chelativorans salis TaxID=2978478 RepID=A0ABT2LTN1_9HYPH|nr:hypothetical protein [Chelativorans sp. EGI FJ00035]MCT7376549.1 hypothetical protein [Chelativorans sp. EGI FJ00035]